MSPLSLLGGLPTGFQQDVSVDIALILTDAVDSPPSVPYSYNKNV